LIINELQVELQSFFLNFPTQLFKNLKKLDRFSEKLRANFKLFGPECTCRPDQWTREAERPVTMVGRGKEGFGTN
jgi:hypothetical protein